MRSINVSAEGISLVGCGYTPYGGAFKILPSWKRGVSNKIHRITSYGDASIGYPNGYEVDGDLIIGCGWSDGISIVKLNNDGTLTKVYDNIDPMASRHADSYFQSIAVCKSNKTLAVAAHRYGGAFWDYSPCFAGNAATQISTEANMFTTGVNIDRVGQSYDSGMVMAGDWLYMGDHDATHYKKYPRRNMVTGVEQLLDGSATVDRNGYRYKLNYDEVNDRVFYFPYYNGSFVMILNASTASPVIVHCDMSDAGQHTNSYESGLFVIDPINAPNVMIVGMVSGHITVDISPCITATLASPVVTPIPAPTVIGTKYDSNSGVLGQAFGNYHRAGPKYQNISNNGQPHDRMLDHPHDFVPTAPDRGRNMLDGWLDMENKRVVGAFRHDALVEDTTTGGRGRSYRSDYGTPMFAMYSANGTRYWIKRGYGQDGHSTTSWADSVGPGLIGNWSATFGTYTSTTNIDMASPYGDDFIVPSGCTIACYLSNDNGSTWEAYDYVNRATTNHVFGSSGTQLKIKFVATGQVHKAPYYTSQKPIGISYGAVYMTEKTPTADIKSKITQSRRRRRRI